MIGPIKTVGIYVEDQQRALTFFTEKLGFVLRRRMPMGPNAEWLDVSPQVGRNLPGVVSEGDDARLDGKETVYRVSLCGRGGDI